MSSVTGFEFRFCNSRLRGGLYVWRHRSRRRLSQTRPLGVTGPPWCECVCECGGGVEQLETSIEGPLSVIFKELSYGTCPFERNYGGHSTGRGGRARRAEMEMQCTEVRRSRASALPCAGRGRAPGCPLTPLLRHFSGRAAVEPRDPRSHTA